MGSLACASALNMGNYPDGAGLLTKRPIESLPALCRHSAGVPAMTIETVVETSSLRPVDRRTRLCSRQAHVASALSAQQFAAEHRTLELVHNLSTTSHRHEARDACGLAMSLRRLFGLLLTAFHARQGHCILPPLRA